jgi:recombination protein RecA
MMHTNGISYEGDILDLGVTHNVVTRSGSWFKYNDAYLGQGKEKARLHLIENPQITEEIKTKVMIAGGYAVDPEEKTVAEEMIAEAVASQGSNEDEL